MSCTGTEKRHPEVRLKLTCFRVWLGSHRRRKQASSQPPGATRQPGINRRCTPLPRNYSAVGGIFPTLCLWGVKGYPGGHGGGCLASSESDELARPYTSGTRSVCGAGEGTLDAVWMVGDGRAIVMVDQ